MAKNLWEETRKLKMGVIRKLYPIHLKFGIPWLINNENVPEADWCKENLEEDYILFVDAIYLKNEEDAIAFKLRWE